MTKTSGETVSPDLAEIRRKLGEPYVMFDKATVLALLDRLTTAEAARRDAERERDEQATDLVDEREEWRERAERAEADLCRWRAAIQEMTPGGSEFMSPEVVADWARMLKRETSQAKFDAAKASKRAERAEARNAELEAALTRWRTVIADAAEKGGFYPTQMLEWMQAAITQALSSRPSEEGR